MPTESASAFFVTGGTLRPDAPCYVERQADRDLFGALLNGEFCYVLTSRQMGKSSLMVRAAVRLREKGVHVVVLDLSAIGQNVDPEQWHTGLLAGIGRQLRLEDELDDYWDNHPRLTPMQRLVAALGEVALARCSGPLVVFVDELDVVRSLPFKTDEFFAAIRACSNRRAEDSEFKRLTFCLLGVATPSDLIQDPRLTPFNIGRRIELHDISATEAAPLAKGLELAAGSPAVAEAALRRILHWTHGHPYLTQRLCKAMATRDGQGNRSALGSDITAAVDAICGELFLTERARELDDNLVFVRERILRPEVDRAAVLHLYEQVLSRSGAPDEESDPLVDILRLAGIVRREGGRLRVRNRIYARAFDQRWVERNMPNAEKLRQREAYRRGVRRTAMVSSAVLLVMGGLVVLALWSGAQARSATWAALRDQARSIRLSGVAGQRFGALDAIRRAARIKASPELREEAIACLVWPDLRQQPSWMVPEDSASPPAFDADLKTYAISTAAGEIVLRTVDGHRELVRWKAGGGPTTRIWFAPDSRHIAVARTNSEVTTLSFWESQSGPLFAVTNRMQLGAFDFSPDSRQVVLGGLDGTVRILNLDGGDLHTEFAMKLPCSLAKYDPTGRWLALSSRDSLTIGLHSPSSGARLRTLHSPSPVTHLAWFPDGRLLAAAGEDRRIRIWEVESDEFSKEEFPPQLSEITGLAFNHSGSLLASTSADRALRLWEPGSARLLLTLSGGDLIPFLQFSPDDQRLGYALSGRGVSFWQVASGNECRTLFDFEADEFSAVDIHPDGGLLAAAHRNGVTLWDLELGRKVAMMSVGGTVAARFQPGSGDLITGEFRGAYCFEVQRQSQPPQMRLRLNPKEDFYLGPGGKAIDIARDVDVVAVAYDDRIRLVRNTNSAYALLREFVGRPGFGSVAINSDGSLVAAANFNSRDVWLWHCASNAPRSNPRQWAVDGRAQLRFSPDGRWLAVGIEKSAALWDVQTFKPAVRVDRASGASRPGPVAFASDGSLWATAITDTRIRVLRIDGKPIVELEAPHKQPLTGLIFSPDGSRLVCATVTKQIVVWDLGRVADGLGELGLEGELNISGNRREQQRPIVVEIGPLNRQRFSESKHILGVRREVGDLTDLIRRTPTAWHLYQYRAKKFLDLGEYAAAIEDYREWLRLDAASTRPATERAWPMRDLALVYLSGPNEFRDATKALALTEEALRLDKENADNHFRHGLACYRTGQYKGAEVSLGVARRAYEKARKNVTVILFYEAMCQARLKKHRTAIQSLERARQDYAKTDLKYRESHADEFADLLWEAEQVVEESDPGG